MVAPAPSFTLPLTVLSCAITSVTEARKNTNKPMIWYRFFIDKWVNKIVSWVPPIRGAPAGNLVPRQVFCLVKDLSSF
jgi:hypothetical protein